MLTEDWKQTHHINAPSSSCLKVLLLWIYAVLLMQGAFFIYSWLTSRKKNPRRKLALKNSAVSFSTGRYCMGFLFQVGLGFSHCSHKVWRWQWAQQWGAAPPLKQWPPALWAASQARRIKTASLQTQLPLPDCCTLLSLVYTVLDMRAFHSTGLAVSYARVK